MSKELQIRNSTVDFLVFTRDAGEDGIEVRVQNGDVWLTQKAISQLFDVDRSVVTKHLSNIFKEGELDENSTCANFAQVADNGKTYNYKFYSLAAIIAVGYRINSERAMQFRTWATKVLDTFTKQGYVLDKSRLINGQIFDEDYFEHLIAEIQEIRASERRFYQKITDIYATAVDYDKNSQVTREFYATVQNKMHYAVHGNTAAEVIVARADHNKEHMGLKSWKNAPDGKIVKTDVSIAKNYLEKEELAELNEIVTMYLDYATRQARRHIPMTMEDWKTKLDAFLRFNDADVLQDKGKVTAAIAKEFAEYYELYQKYQQDYQIAEILKGQPSEAMVKKVSHASFDERVSVVNLLFSGVRQAVRDAVLQEDVLEKVFEVLKSLKEPQEGGNLVQRLGDFVDNLRAERERKQTEGLLERREDRTIRKAVEVLEGYVTILKKEQTENWEEAFDIVKNAFGEYRASWDAVWDESGSTLEYAFDFMEAAFYNSQEMVIFVSGINTDYSCVRFLETYECERYIRYNRDLLFEDASQEIRRRIEEL